MNKVLWCSVHGDYTSVKYWEHFLLNANATDTNLALKIFCYLDLRAKFELSVDQPVSTPTIHVIP